MTANNHESLSSSKVVPPPFISCVVPVFNETEVVTPFLEALTEQLKAISPEFEIIVVDDGSKDDTALQVEVQSQNNTHIRLIALSRNFGKEAALTAGIDAVTGDVTLLIDADFQHPLEMIPVFMKLLAAGIRYDLRNQNGPKR